MYFYQRLLNERLSLSQRSNPQLGLRSIARKIAIEPGSLLQILKGKRIPHDEQIAKLLVFLELNEQDQREFKASVLAARLKSSKSHTSLLSTIEAEKLTEALIKVLAPKLILMLSLFSFSSLLIAEHAPQGVSRQQAPMVLFSQSDSEVFALRTNSDEMPHLVFFEEPNQVSLARFLNKARGTEQDGDNFQISLKGIELSKSGDKVFFTIIGEHGEFELSKSVPVEDLLSGKKITIRYPGVNIGSRLIGILATIDAELSMQWDCINGVLRILSVKGEASVWRLGMGTISDRAQINGIIGRRGEVKRQKNSLKF